MKQLSEAEARALTEEYRRSDHSQWASLLRLYEGRAHEALGFKSWGNYAWDELGLDDSEAYRILDAARVERQLAVLQMETDGLRKSQTRHLARLLRQDGAAFEEAVRLVHEEGGWNAVTGKRVQQIVDRGWLLDWERQAYAREKDAESARRELIAERERVTSWVRTAARQAAAAKPTRLEEALRALSEHETAELATMIRTLVEELRFVEAALPKNTLPAAPCRTADRELERAAASGV